ncbi:MAG TPA: glycosyltransferase [Nitriliruptorales bacterium]|nr:glycosyltransferase [Nitriliruptorales bacterium]
MRRILLLIKGLGRGGAEQLILSAARYLDTDRFAYEVAYLLPHKDALVPELEAAGLPVHCLGAGATWPLRLRRLVAQRSFDLVHLHSPFAAVGARLVIGWQGHPALVSTEHIVWGAYHPLTYWANVATFFRNRHVFAVSEDVASSVRYPAPLRFLPMPPVEVLHHGLDPEMLEAWSGPNGVRDELGIPPDAPVVGTVANFKAHKGHEYLLGAALRVRDRLPDVRFVLVGQGPLEGQIRRLAHDLGLEGTVLFAGYRDDAPRVAAACDVFALSSIHEGLSIALIEALATGTPAVVTQAGGLREVVEHGEQGFVVPTRDPDALAEAILTLLHDEDLRRRFGQAGRRRAVRFDIRRAVRRWEEVYGRVLASSGDDGTSSPR